MAMIWLCLSVCIVAPSQKEILIRIRLVFHMARLGQFPIFSSLLQVLAVVSMLHYAWCVSVGTVTCE